MPGMFKGGSGVQPGQPTPFQNFAITAAPMFSAMAAGYSSGRGPYAYMDQGLASMQARAKEKRDQEAAAAASAAFAGLVPGGNGSASYGTKGGYSGKGIWAPTTGPIPKADVGVYGGGKGGLSFGNLPAADTGVAQGGLSFAKPGGNELPDQIYAGLIARGHSPVAAHGIMMNLQDESAFNLGAVGDGGNAFGLAQWNGPRKRQLEAFAASQGKSPADLDVQLDFLTQELQGPEAAAGAALAAATTPGEAGAAFVNMFERPAEEHRSSREAKYLAYSGGSPEVTMSAKGEDSLALGAPPDPLTDPYVQQLMQVLAMPGLTPQQQAVVQLQLEGRMKTLTTPQPGAEEEAARARRARDAELLGYGRGTPEWNQYVVTGDVPKADPIEVGGVLLDPTGKNVIFDSREPGARPMTAEERKAWDIPETDATPYKMTDNGPVAIGSGGITVNNNMGDGGKFAEEFAKGDAATIETVYNSGLSAQRNLARIDQLDALLQSAPVGFEGAAKQFAGEWGISTEGLDAVQSAQALINSLVPEQRQPGSGPMSDADLDLFKKSLPRIANQPGGNKVIIDTMRAIAEYDAEGARIVQRMRLPETDPNYLDRAGAFAALQNRANPLAALAKGSGSVVQPESATNADGWQTLPNGVKVRVKQ